MHMCVCDAHTKADKIVLLNEFITHTRSRSIYAYTAHAHNTLTFAFKSIYYNELGQFSFMLIVFVN